MISRRDIVLGSAALASTSALGQGSKPTVRFGVLYPNLTAVIHAIAVAGGCYERAGVTVEETRFKSGQTVDGMQQLWRGNLDFWMAGSPEIAKVNSRDMEIGKPAPLVVLTGSNPGHTTLVLSNKITSKSIDELLTKPLKIAVSSPSSVHLAFFSGYLRIEKKLDVSSVPWKFLAMEAGNMLPALTTNQVDGFLHSEPTSTLAVVHNIGHIFMHGARGDMGPNPPPGTFLGTRREFLQKNPDAVRRFMTALYDANRIYREGPKSKMLPIISSWTGQDDKIVDAAYERMDPTVGLTKEQAIKWWDVYGKTLIERGEVISTINPDRDIFDLSWQPA